jgi:hypothetical protein
VNVATRSIGGLWAVPGTPWPVASLLDPSLSHPTLMLSELSCICLVRRRIETGPGAV